MRRTNVLFRFVIILLVILGLLTGFVTYFNMFHLKDIMLFTSSNEMDFTHADNTVGFDHAIVPNIFHYVHFQREDLEFVEVISIKSVHLNHRPDKIIIHCDCHSLKGKYWDMVKDIPYLEVTYRERPTQIFNQNFSGWIEHVADVVRIQILMEQGGIYLDRDTYIIKSLNDYRRFELAIGWHENENIGSQLIVAHKDARFLKLWYDSYHYYNPNKWYFNIGQLPTIMILDRDPGLVHRVKRNFGVTTNLASLLYGMQNDMEWRTYDAIHLLFDHRKYMVPSDKVEELNEETIKTYNRTFGYMARLVLYNTVDYV